MLKKNLRIFLADDHQIFIEGMKTVLSQMEQFQCDIIAEINSGEELLKQVLSMEVDVLFLDINFPDMDGLHLLSNIRKLNKEVRIIVVSMFDESKIVKAAFQAGTDGYILKSSGASELELAVETVLTGDTFLGKNVSLTNRKSSQKVSDRMGMTYEDSFVKRHNLTKREIEVLRLISKAMSNKEIAKELFISDQTVSVHRKNIMRKLAVSSTAGLMKIVYESNVV